MKDSLRILVVDDHSLFAEALAGVVKRLAPVVHVETVTSAELALSTLEHASFDVVLLDLGLPGLRGKAAFDAVQSRAQQAALIVVTAAEPNADAVAMLRAGARGYVHKRTGADELLQVLEFVVGGGTWVPPSMRHAPVPTPEELLLTGRQREVLKLLARGASNQDIAESLGISQATVRVHVSSIMRALQVDNRTQAATSALARRLAESD